MDIAHALRNNYLDRKYTFLGYHNENDDLCHIRYILVRRNICD